MTPAIQPIALRDTAAMPGPPGRHRGSPAHQRGSAAGRRPPARRVRRRACAGSLSIPLRAVFASWLGWLADPGRPLVFVLGQTRTGPSPSARHSTSAMSTSPASSPGASTPGSRGVPASPDHRLEPAADAAGWSSMCARPTSSRPATSPVPATSSSARSPDTAGARAGHGDVRARRTGHDRRQHPRRARPPRRVASLAGGPDDWAARHRPAPRDRPVTHHRDGTGRPAGAAGEPRPVLAARRRQRARRRDDRPGTHRAAAARATQVFGLTAFTAALTFIVAFGVGEGRHQLLRRHPLGPLRPQARARRRLDHRPAGPVAVDVGAVVGLDRRSPTCCSASTRASPGRRR